MLTKLRVGVAAASLALIASGCGGSDVAEGNLGASILAAATNTADAKTSKASMAITMSGTSPAQTEPMTITLDGDLDYRTNQGSFVVNTPAVAGTPSSSSEMVVDNTIAYVKLPAEAVPQFNGKSWIKIDTAETSKEVGVDISSLSTESGNPAQGLEMLRGVSDDIVEVGNEDIRGTKTTHYSGNLDFVKAADAESDQAKKDALLKLGQLYGNQPLPVHVWLDGDDRVRKMTYSIDMAKLTVSTTTPQQAASGTMDFAMEFYDFGTDVNVVVPPADQVITQAEIEQLAAQQPAAA